MVLKVKDMANVAGLAVAACCVVGGTVATGGGLLAALASGSLLLDCVLDDKRSDLQASIKKVQKSTAEEVAQIALVHDVSQAELDEVSKALNDAAYHTGASHADFARWNYDPTIVAERMLERLCHNNDLFETSEFASALAKGVLFKAFETVRQTDGFQKKADIYFKTEALTKLDAIDMRTQTILDKLERLEDGGKLAIEQDTEKSIKQTIRGLITAQEGARKRAGEKLEANPPDPDGAKIELRQLAAQQEGNVRAAAQTYMDIGNIAYMNDTHEALEAYTRVTELTPDDPRGWNRVGIILRRLGDLDGASKAFFTVLEISKTNGNKGVEADALGNLGNVFVNWKKLNKAEKYYMRALEIDKELGQERYSAYTYGNLGIIAGMRNNNDRAKILFSKSLALHEKFGKLEGMANQYGNLGNVELIRENYDIALLYYSQNLALEKRMGRKEGIAHVYTNIGIVEHRRTKLDSACQYWQKAYILYGEIGLKNLQVDLLVGMRGAGCEGVPGDGSD